MQSPLVVTGQRTSANSADGEALYDQGNLLQAKGKMKEAFQAFEKAKNIFMQVGSCGWYLASIFNMANCAEDVEYRQIVGLKEEMDSCLNQQSFYAALGKIALGRSYDEIGKLDLARHWYEKALQELLANYSSEQDQIGTVYNNLGTIYHQLGDYKRAEDYYQKSLKLDRGLDEAALLEEVKIAMNLAIVVGDAGDINESIFIYKSALAKLSQITPSPAYRWMEMELFNNLGTAYLEQNRPDSALIYLNRKLALAEKFPDPLTEGTTFKHIGHALFLKGDYIQAQYYLEKSLEIKKERFGAKHIQLAVSQELLGKLFFEQKAFTKADSCFELAIANLVPAQGESWKGVLYKQELLRMLEAQADNYVAWYQKDSVESNLYFAQGCFEKAVSLLDLIRFELVTEQAFLFFSAQGMRIFEKAISCTFLLYELKQENAQLNQAFHWIESSKSMQLYLQMQDEQVKIRIGIPDSLLQFEKKLKSQAFAIKQQILKLKEGGNSREADYQRFLEQDFSISRKLDSLRFAMEAAYPAYVHQKNDLQATTIEEVQSKLTKDMAMISYFLGEKLGYAMLIDKETSTCIQLKGVENLPRQIRQLRAAMMRSDEKSWGDYMTAAHFLYQKLIAPFGDALPQRLLIIPSEEIGLIPFDALLRQAPHAHQSAKKLDYLLHHHAISYAWSANLWCRTQLKEVKAPKPFLGFAPIFAYFSQIPNPNRASWLALPGSEDEIRLGKKLMGGDIFEGKKALKTTFLQHAAGYRVIHLSTHAQAHDSLPALSFIAFYDTGQVSVDSLTYGELYQLRLSADLVVLSACETAKGRLQKGEGISSLARAFTHTGAKSLVTTRWQVDNSSTSKIIQSFYLRLSDRMPKDLALQQAKISYLSAAKEELGRTHPMFWAPHTLMGDASPLLTSNRLFIYLCCSFLGLLGVFGWFLKKNRKKIS